MKYSRFLCIVLCLILLVSISPIQAHAISTGTAVTVGAGVAVAGILVGLGLMPDSAQPEVFSNLVDTVTQSLKDLGKIGADMLITVLNPREGIYYIQRDIIQTVFDVCVSTGAVSSSPSFSTSASCSFMGNSFSYSSEGPISFVCGLYGTNPTFLGLYIITPVSDCGQLFDSSGSVVNWESKSRDGRFFYKTISWGKSVSDLSQLSCSCYTWFMDGYYHEDRIATLPDVFSSPVSDGLVAGDVVAAPGSAVSDSYPDWGNSEISSDDPDGNVNVPWWVLSVPASIAAADALTQTDVWQGLGSFIEEVPATLDSILSALSSFWGDVVSLGQDLYNGLLNILELLRSWAATAVDFFSRSWVAFKDAAISFWGSITSTLSDILEWIKALPAAIAEAISALLSSLFVPDVAEITAAVDAMALKFPFFNSIIDTWRSFQVRLSGSPPVIYAHLQNAEGNYSWGGTVAVLDMSFYERYKSLGDAVLSAALWCFFGWRIFVKLPGIISGVPGDVQTSSYVDDIERGSRKK